MKCPECGMETSKADISKDSKMKESSAKDNKADKKIMKFIPMRKSKK